MTGNDEVVRATLSDTRAQAAIAARRFGVPPTMIEAAGRRRAVGDWRGACSAAGVDIHLNPDSVRRRHGATAAGQLLADLRTLAPDLLRWHLPRHGHGAGQLVEGLLVPLAEYPDASGSGIGFTLVAATPRLALDAGQRVVLTTLEGGVGRGRGTSADPVVRAVLDGVRLRSVERHDLRRHRMLWDAAHAPRLAELCAGALTPDAATRLQDAGRAPAAWAAADIDVVDETSRTLYPDLQHHLTRWLTTVPVNLPGLAQRVREALPGADHAVIRSGGGAIVVRGLGGTDNRVSAEAVPSKALQGLPVVPAAAWLRPVDADLLRFGLTEPRELHPLVASALSPAEYSADPTPDERLYRTVPNFEAPCADGSGTASIVVRCGTALHRVTQIEGDWQTVDHDNQPSRERLLTRLGGQANPCRQAAQYLGTGRHIIDVVEALLEHGRVPEILDLLHRHADISAAPDDLDLPGGGTVGEALSSLRENTLQLRMILAGASPVPNPRSPRPSRPLPRRLRSRKGVSARPQR